MKKSHGTHTNLWLAQIFNIASKQVGPSEQVSTQNLLKVKKGKKERLIYHHLSFLLK